VRVAGRAPPPTRVSAEDAARVQEGLEQLHGRGIAERRPSRVTPCSGWGHPRIRSDHSPLWYLIGLPRGGAARRQFQFRAGAVADAFSFTFCSGSLLGASPWYVSRRLYGNAEIYRARAVLFFSQRSPE
jgi:hypothetical protein